jgi:hypothetical protein
VRDDSRTEVSVHDGPLAFGAFALPREPELFHFLLRALAEPLGRQREQGKATLLSGFSLAA